MIHPSNKIVLDSQNCHIQTMKIETATTMYAGRLVKKGTGDDDAVVVAAATDPIIGWLGYEQTTKKHRPATVDTIYAADAQVAVLSGPGMVILGTLASAGVTCVKGTRLKAAPAGTLSGGTDGTDHIVAIAEETATNGADVLVRSLI
jgi:hypothetical protein